MIIFPNEIGTYVSVTRAVVVGAVLLLLVVPVHDLGAIEITELQHAIFGLEPLAWLDIVVHTLYTATQSKATSEKNGKDFPCPRIKFITYITPPE